MSKLQRLRDNIAAIEHALKGGNDREVLAKYSGFGGMNFILNPKDKECWSKSDMMYFEDTMKLHEVLREHSKNGNELVMWMQSLKASVLTAFYTPHLFVFNMMQAIADKTIYGPLSNQAFKTFLDPAAGNGVFISCANYHLNNCTEPSDFMKVAYEKDLLTGLILQATYPAQLQSWSTDVRVAGFETIPASELGKFDLVATNVPFGDIAVFDPAYSNSKEDVRRDAAKMIHRYYVLKGLDCLRAGGIEAYIITSNYLNRDGEQLAEALKQARLIGAYRLANNLFKDAGTEVGTDLLVLQKDSRKEGITAEESMLLTQYEDNGCPTNMYFQCYPDHIVATNEMVGTDAYGKPGFVYTHKDGVPGISRQMGEQLAKDMQERFDRGLFENGGDAIATQETKTKPAAKATGTMTKSKEPKLTEREEKMLAMHKVYTELYEYEATKQNENTELRKELNRLYDEFQLDFGCLNNCHNKPVAKKLKIEDILALEYRDENGVVQKADIFYHPVAFSTAEPSGTVMTAQEALAWSLNRWGRVELTEMSYKTGTTEEELLEVLDGEVYYNPINGEWETKAKFVSGDVISKIDAIEKVKSEELRVKNALEALRASIPTPIPFEDLNFNLGVRWVDPSVYGAFASEFFSMPEDATRSSYWSGAVMVTVKYEPLLDLYAVSNDYSNEKIWTQFAVSSEATKEIDGMGLLVHALQNTCPKMMKYKRDANGRCIYKDNGEHEKVEDPEKTQLANSKIEEIRQAFQDWLQQQPREWKDGIAEVYNRKFNCFVKPKYDGSHQTFPGVDWKGLEAKYGVKDLYQSQKDCVWMLVQNQGGICDHEVGSGKTLIMCIASHEMKRLGLCHKPMIIGLKANVAAIAETYRTAYPQAKLLYAAAKDYSGSERVNFFNRMKNNDWDCVIMSHDQFGFIPQSQDIELEMLWDELRHVDDSLAAVNKMDWKISSQMRKGLERRKRNLEAKRLALQDSIRNRKDDVVDFQMMGVDHIFIDESHMFKNLGFVTRQDRVAGIGNSEGSKRAYNLLMAIRTIQKRTGRDLGATFLSGTTVTNSLTELYSLFRYLRPQALRKQGITCFDAWAAIFTKKSQEYEFSITNQIVLKERFRYFVNVPELAMFYNEITDFRTAEDVGIDRPAKHCMLLNIAPTPDQEEFIKTLMKFAQTGDFKLIGKYDVTDKQEKAKMLYATDMARKMSLDMRMIDPSYGDHPRSKASKCAELVKKYYDAYSEQKGTQLIFSDLSTWQGQGKGWNVYEEIKQKLVSMGIPAKEIRFIQETKCDSKKQQLIDEVNNGNVRVLFGSTSMLGTGVNAQQRVVAVHHLDTPWRPSDLEQRDGRAIRKGNEIAKLYADNKVDIIIYAVERSLDSYKFNLLHCKQTFIQQLKRGQLSIRTLDEGAMDENTGMNFSEYMAVLSGNTDLLTRAKLEKKIAGLEAEKKNFYREQREQQERRDGMEKENEVLQRSIEAAGEDYRQFEAKRRLNADGSVYNDITLERYNVPADIAVGSDDWKKAIGERLISISRSAHTDGAHIPVGSIYGFRLLVRTAHSYVGDDGKIEYDNVFSVEGSTLKHTFNNGYLNHTSPRISADYPLKALLAIPDRIRQWEAKVSENESRIAQLDSILHLEWGKEEQLRQARTDLGILDRKIADDLRKSENQEGGYKQAA